jgi:hypothetical protein
MWVALGFTPKIDMPAYDPWNPKWQDQKRPRIFYLEQNQLRTIKLKDSQTPLQMLGPNTVLVSEGNDYFQRYLVQTYQDMKLAKEREIDFDAYRMLIGAIYSKSHFNLSASVALPMPSMNGPSTPGSFWSKDLVSGLEYNFNRKSPLEAVVAVVGTFSDGADRYSIAQTHYDLRLFDGAQAQGYNLSLNRYSYIPSMIARSQFFPTWAEVNGKRAPAVYLPVSPVNPISEVALFDRENRRFYKPAALRFKPDTSCLSLGNLFYSADGSAPKQAFVCAGKLVVREIGI